MIFSINQQSNIPLYQQIYYQLKQWISDGKLKKNDPLPSKRQLAKLNDVSINTVMNAYDQLLTEGYIYAKERKGYFVADLDFQYLQHDVPLENSNSDKEESPLFNINWASSQVDASIFPTKVIKKIANQIIDEEMDTLLKTMPVEGDWNLRQSLQHYLTLSRGVPTTANQIIIGPSSIYLLNILLQLPINRIKYVGIENPGYHRYLPLFEQLNIRVIQLTVDNEGLLLEDSIRDQLDIIIVTPNHQFPTGTIMPLKRRHALLQWANEKEHRLIIEDDYDSEYKYSGLTIPSLTQLDHQEKIIYMSSFARTLATGFRLSFMVIPHRLLPSFNQYKAVLSPSLNTLNQKMIAKFISDGHLEKHLNRSRTYYKKKRDLLTQTILNFDPKGIIKGEDAGLHLLYQPSFYFKSNDFKASLLEQKIKVNLLSDYTMGALKEDSQILFLSFSSIPMDQMINAYEQIWHSLNKFKQ